MPNGRISPTLLRGGQDLQFPEFGSIREQGGMLKAPYRLATEERLQGIEAGGPGYQAFQKRALAAPGTSPWEQMMMGRQATEEAQARDIAQRQGAQMGSGIWNRLAMRGGAGAGARERAALAGHRAGLRGLQDVARGGTLARADIGLEGERQRMGMLQQLPGMEFARTQFGTGLRQQDIMNQLRDLESQRGFEMGKYQMGMRERAAEEMAKAIENQGGGGLFGGGGFLGLGF